jgi:hypothetical protein
VPLRPADNIEHVQHESGGNISARPTHVNV